MSYFRSQFAFIFCFIHISLIHIRDVTLFHDNGNDDDDDGSNQQAFVDEGDSIYLNCSQPEEDLVNNLNWLKNGKHVPNFGRFSFQKEDYSLLIRSSSPDDDGFYSCELNTTGPSIVLNKIKLVVREKLKFHPAPISKKLELGSSGKIHCKAKSYMKPVITWVKEGSLEQLPPRLKVENGTLFFTNVTKEDAGKYVCIATNIEESINATIQVDIVVLPKFVVQPVSKSVIEGKSIVLNCAAEGDPTPTIHWDKDNSLNAFDASRFVTFPNGTLFIKQAQLEDTGKYGCTAGNSGGFKRTETTLRVLSSNETVNLSTLPNEKQLTETVSLTLGAAALYIVFVLILMIWCRCRRAKKKATSVSQGSRPDLNKVENGDVEMKDCNNHHQQQQVMRPAEQDKLLSESEKEPQLKNGNKMEGENSRASSSQSSKQSKSSRDRLHFFRHDLQTIMLLGHGEFGDVYLAKAPHIKENEPESIVMVKTLHSKDGNIIYEFKREMDMFRKLHHQNIAELLGICREQEPALLLMEYTDWGDLKQFLLATRKENNRRGLKPNPLGTEEIIKIAYQIAIGMDHLTSNRFIHKDLATRNCLITSELNIKISSTSLSKDTYSAEYVFFRGRDVPIRWAPHEAVIEDEWSTKSDVWSYGVLIWEIFNQAELPYPNKSDDVVLRSLQMKQLRLNAPANVPHELQKLLVSCWSDNPRLRPEFSQLSLSLKELMSQEYSEKHNLLP